MSRSSASGHLSEPQLDRLRAGGDAGRPDELAHLAACSDCRRRWAESDPSALFGLLALDPVDEADLDRLSAQLDRALDQTAGRRRSLPIRRWSALAASLLLAALIGGLGGPRSPEPGASQPLPSAAAPIERAGASADRLPVGGAVQVVSSPGRTQVLDLTVGGTQLVMIFDKDLDL